MPPETPNPTRIFAIEHENLTSSTPVQRDTLSNHYMKPHRLLQMALMMASVFAPDAVAGQSLSETGLILRAESPRSVRPCEGKKDNQDCVRFRMVFENRGKEPVIVINPTLSFGTGIKQLRVFFEEYGEKPRTYIDVEGARKSALVDPANLEAFRSVAPLFDADRPPQNLTIILQPGESFTFDESFLVDSDPRIPEKDFAEIRRQHPIGDECDSRGCQRLPSGLTFVYEFSFLPYFEDPAFLDKLASRWRPYGRLPVDVDGSYKITSEMARRRF